MEIACIILLQVNLLTSLLNHAIVHYLYSRGGQYGPTSAAMSATIRGKGLKGSMRLLLISTKSPCILVLAISAEIWSLKKFSVGMVCLGELTIRPSMAPHDNIVPAI